MHGAHLLHLHPLAQDALLCLFNMSWRSAEVPSIWRRAVIILIPNAGKDPQDVSSYRPISLTSHVAKLMERMVAASLTYLLDRDDVIPAEQVGFRRERSAEDNLGRLVQEVQPAETGRHREAAQSTAIQPLVSSSRRTTSPGPTMS